MKSKSLSKQVLVIAIPVSLKLFLDMAMVLIDLFMIGHLGTAELTAVGMGLVILSASIGVLDNLFVTGGGILVARYIGANKYQKAFNALGAMLIISLPLYLMCLLAIPFIQDAYILFRTTVEVSQLGSLYLGTLYAGSLFIFLDVLLFTYFVSTGNSKLPMQIKIVSLILNVVFNYMFVFGHFGLPALGVQGAALGTIVATAFNVGVYIIILKRTQLISIKFKAAIFHIRRILNLGIPSLIENLTFQLSWLFVISLINGYAASVAAGFQIGYRVESIAFLPGLGTAAAAATLVSQFLGASRNNEIKDVVTVTAKVTCLFMGGLGVLMAIAPESFARVFTDEAKVIHDASSYIRIMGLAQIPLGLQFVYTATLRGLGDVSKTALIKVILLWTSIVIPCLIVTALDLGIIWLFSIIAIANIVDATIFGRRLRKRLNSLTRNSATY